MTYLTLLITIFSSLSGAAFTSDCARAAGDHPEVTFSRAWRALGGHDAPAVFADLVGRYQEPARAYHTTEHIEDGLRRLDEFLAEHPDWSPRRDLLVVAFWFHDAIYDPHQPRGNERASADLFLAKSRGFASHDRWAIDGLVMATATHEATSELERLFVDIDLSILGSEPSHFARFERLIRKEYAWVPRDTYVAKRGEVLARFAARRPLYQTEYFRRRFEDQAHRNLLAATLDGFLR